MGGKRVVTLSRVPRIKTTTERGKQIDRPPFLYEMGMLGRDRSLSINRASFIAAPGICGNEPG